VSVKTIMGLAKATEPLSE